MAQHEYPPRFLRLRVYVRAVVTSVLCQVFPCVLKPWVVSTPFRVEYQSATAEVAGVAVVSVKLCSDRAREALITVKRDKGFGINRHSIGPLPYDRAGVNRPKEGSSAGHRTGGVKSGGRCDCVRQVTAGTEQCVAAARLPLRFQASGSFCPA